MDAIVEHPELAAVDQFELYCRESMIPFYEQWDFTDDLGDLHVLRRE
jgi:hypothetical protein